MNRETKRLMQRQGQIGADGQPTAPSRPPRSAANVRREVRSTPFGFIREVRTEMRKVNWPSREELRSYSIIVLVTVAVLMALIFGLDYGFSQGAVFLFK